MFNLKKIACETACKLLNKKMLRKPTKHHPNFLKFSERIEHSNVTKYSLVHGRNTRGIRV
jgi:hypothetical protein